MRFFSKVTFLCNICFIIMVIMSYIELGRRAKGNSEAIIKLPLMQNTVVVLGWTAIFLNFIFVILTIYLLFSKRLNILTRWIVIFNLLIFVWQIAFHFNLY